ncbi:MAG: hypothetical protein GY757_28845 [bacterium]|nr:hypothetical protein [bacterium]
MKHALKERIGKPELFTGRKEELGDFLEWIDDIKEEKSQSTAIMARRKMGKTALIERLFNITFHKNDGVIPFYYEVKEKKMWVVDFCKDFFFTFAYQYIAFKTRNPEYMLTDEIFDFEKLIHIAQKEGLDYLTGFIKSVAFAESKGYSDAMWEVVRVIPHKIAARRNESILQMIDEFQFLNDKIYRDKSLEKKIDDMAAGYLSTAESKIAPLLVSGSWVGGLMNQLNMMLPARFAFKFLKNMPHEEAVETVFNYSRFFRIPITGETAYLIAKLAEGNPFYVSSFFRSSYKPKDLTTIKGLTEILEFETLDNEGRIKNSWGQYIESTFPRINDRNAKNIVLYLCKHRDREVTRKELLNQLKLDLSDGELERRLKALVRADIIQQGQSNYDYRGVQDNIFDKVFRGVYEKEIRQFDVKVIAKEYTESFNEFKKQYNTLQGKYNHQKGHFAEYVISDQLRYRARKNNDLFKSYCRFLPGDFDFCEYSRVWKYDGSLEYGKGFNVDIFARSRDRGDYSIISEIKNRETGKFSREEAVDLEWKLRELKKLENIDPVVGFIFCSAGFTKEAETYCKEKSIACSEDERWLDS